MSVSESVPETEYKKMVAYYHKWRKEVARPVAYLPDYVDVISWLNPAVKDDVPTAVLLSQIIYWCLPDRNGKTRLSVYKKGHWWLAKNREEWYQETRLSKERTDRALTVLEKVGLIERHNFMFSGKRTTHVRLITATYVKAWHNTIHNIAPKVITVPEEVITVPEVIALAYDGRGESRQLVAVNPGDRLPSTPVTGPSEMPRPLTETISQTTPQTTDREYSSAPLPPIHGGTPLSRYALSQESLEQKPLEQKPLEQKPLEWATASLEEKNSCRERARAEHLKAGWKLENINESWIDLRARHLYEKQIPEKQIPEKQIPEKQIPL